MQVLQQLFEDPIPLSASPMEPSQGPMEEEMLNDFFSENCKGG